MTFEPKGRRIKVSADEREEIMRREFEKQADEWETAIPAEDVVARARRGLAGQPKDDEKRG